MLIILASVSGIAMFTQVGIKFDNTQIPNSRSSHVLTFLFSKTICMTSAAEKLIMRMRSKAFNSILRQPIGWFDMESSSAGYLITRLARDAPLVKAVSSQNLSHAFI